MRILLISYHFAPYNTMGAVRASKTAKYLVRGGHSVRVVSARSQGLPETLELEIPGSTVSWTPWLGIRRRPEQPSPSPAAATEGPPAPGRRGMADAAYRSLRWSSRNLIYVPDREIGWFPFAVREAVRVAARQRPDVVYASGPPYTSLLVGSCVASRVRTPLVCELRDPWAGSGLRHIPRWAGGLDAGLERLVLSSASGLVADTAAHAELLRARVQRPTLAMSNGFDPEDYPPREVTGRRDVLEVVYTGELYEGVRDPTPLLEAVRALSAESVKVRVHFYGHDSYLALQRATAVGVEACVVAHAAVPYRDSLRAQVESDVLVLLDQGELTDTGNAPGKLYEYLGARRPILVVGRPDYAAAELVAGMGLGVVSRSPARIARFLRDLSERKQRDGHVPDLAADVSRFTRANRAEALAGFLEQVVRDATRRGSRA